MPSGDDRKPSLTRMHGNCRRGLRVRPPPCFIDVHYPIRDLPDYGPLPRVLPRFGDFATQANEYGGVVRRLLNSAITSVDLYRSLQVELRTLLMTEQTP